MRGIIIASHSFLCEGFLNATKMIAGDIKNIHTVSLQPEEGIKELKEKLLYGYKQLLNEDYNEILVFTDLYGGTPSNTCFMNFIDNKNVSIITGINMAMLLSAVVENNISIERLIEIGKLGIVDLKKQHNEIEMEVE